MSRITTRPSVKIVVLQRGWVVVGYVTETPDRIYIDNARIIRTWGTTKGLGELVNGPTPETKLDPAGLVEAHPLTVVLMIVADLASWEETLGKL